MSESNASVQGGLPRSHGQTGNPALARCDALPEDLVRRMQDAGVDVARLFEREQRRGVLRVTQPTTRGVLDGDRAAAGGHIGRESPREAPGAPFISLSPLALGARAQAGRVRL